MSVPKIGRGSLHRKYDRHQGRIKHARDRTNSLCDSTTAPETVGGARICICKRSNQVRACTPGFTTSNQKLQLCLVADSTNSSIFGILETSTQLII
ncbi:hypothetical protein [Microcoleus sp. B4-D4]|uniref:hypothetical protein n=1 Tax=Microcoleus sp. B4-D4 TaxID=2818667 RepID=UPI002FD5BC01